MADKEQAKTLLSEGFEFVGGELEKGDVSLGSAEASVDSVEAMVTVLEGKGAEELIGTLSSPTLANAGSYMVAAYEIGSKIAEGDLKALEVLDIANMALDLVMDVVTELIPAIANAVPLVGQVFGAVTDILQVVFAHTGESSQERMAAWKERMKNCEQRLENMYLPIETGAGGQVPADLFIQSYRSGMTRQGEPKWEATGRVPMVGAMLEVLTEYRLPVVAFNEDFSANASLKERAAYFGVDKDHYAKMGGLYTQRPVCESRPLFPTLPQATMRAFSQLRKGILNQSIAARQMKGLPPGDGGISLWPVYMDLLYAAIRQDQWPYGQKVPSWSPMPPLREEMIRRFYGTNMWLSHYPDQLEKKFKLTGVAMSWPWVVGEILDLNYWLSTPCDYLTTDYRRLFQIAGPCKMDAEGTIDGVISLADQWANKVRPIYAPDIAAQRKQIEQVLSQSAVAGSAAAAQIHVGKTKRTSTRAGKVLSRAAKVGERLLAELGADEPQFLAPGIKQKAAMLGKAMSEREKNRQRMRLVGKIVAGGAAAGASYYLGKRYGL